MQNPLAFKPDQPVTTIGKVFGTSLAMQGWSWLPVNQLAVWGLFTWRSTRKHTAWNWLQHAKLGSLQMIALLGSEWCHNLAHVAAARAVGKPVDTVRILLGMPVLLYNEPEHPSITPRQHLTRSLAGPVCNFGLLIISKLFQRATTANSPAREVADTAVGMNTFISTASLLPVPVFDGGPILKWSLIGGGASVEKAAEIISRSQKVIGAGLFGSALIAFRKRRWFLATLLVFLSLLSLLTGFGKLKY
jgi:Zn-dependent protease